MHFRVLQQKHMEIKNKVRFSAIIAGASQGGSPEQHKHICQSFAWNAERHSADTHLACCDVSQKGKVSVMSAMHTLLQVTQHRKASSS